MNLAWGIGRFVALGSLSFAVTIPVTAQVSPALPGNAVVANATANPAALSTPAVAQVSPAAPGVAPAAANATNPPAVPSAPAIGQALPTAPGTVVPGANAATLPIGPSALPGVLASNAAPSSAAPIVSPVVPAANPATNSLQPQAQLSSPPATMNNAVPVLPAANSGPILQIQGLQGESVPWSIIVLLTGLTLIPSILLCITPFARLLIVFHFLRQALGLQTTPSNQTLIGLSLILTFFLMQPVGLQIYQTAVVPMQAGKINAMEALGRSEGPIRKFMSHYVREKDVALFVELAKEPRPATVDDISMRVMLPAYILSELKAGFQIGTVLFLPFLIVDMVVASITTSVGMLQLPPVVISTPLKLLLFLMVDGWHLLIGSLMRSFS